MQDSSLMSNDQMYQQALDQVQKEIDDMEAAEIAASQVGKGLGDYDLSAATAKVRQARVTAEKMAQQQQTMNQNMAQFTPPAQQAPLEKPTVAPAPAPAAEKKGQFELGKDFDTEKYSKARENVRAVQDKLNAKLLEKNPEIQEYYNKTMASDPVERKELFKNIPNTYLSPEEAYDILGDGDKTKGKQLYENFTNDLKYYITQTNQMQPGTWDVAGTLEDIQKGPLKYGIRTATFLRAANEKEKTVAEAMQEHEDIAKRLGRTTEKAEEEKTQIKRKIGSTPYTQ